VAPSLLSDPLGILEADLADVKPPELELTRYGFIERDLDKEVTLGPGILPHFATEENKTMKLREIIKLANEFTVSWSFKKKQPFVNNSFYRWRCQYSLRSHPRQGTMRLDSRAHWGPKTLELHR
jgi:hypothetical protein